MPPVRLPSEAELARDALAAPLLHRAVRLARWAAHGVPVGAGGELLADELKSAVAVLAIEAEEDAAALAADAWNFAVDTGLVEVEEAEDAVALAAEDAVIGTATGGAELTRITEGTPADVLDIWAAGVEAVLADASAPMLEDLVEGLGAREGAFGDDGEPDQDTIDLDALDWDPEEEADYLDAALGSLYLFAVTDDAGQAATPVPLPMVAAASVIPEDMDELSEAALDDLSATVLKLNGQFRALAGTGLLEYRPVDESVLLAEEGEEQRRALPEAEEEEDLGRYGQARLTPLGLYGVRRRMIEAGLAAPVVGELAGQDARALLGALPYLPEAAAHEEAELWLAEREPLDAARELLDAARGGDPAAPGRRLGCQLVLALLDERADGALREVLHDAELGGLARVWLVERGVVDVPPPSDDMVFWLTIDTLAAQLATANGGRENAEELRELVTNLAAQHSGFFERAWRTDHPATAEVLDAVGRLHPDKQLAKQARKAAFKSRSRD
ncbi:hypothetical protein [Streptomyces hoynatensis]|uniref:Uncharacterized protein n=1 Tax=Streptomyces hoynatensis TaxID=1141874 RepID=A0A3A9Z316_9ACTN|nr:hypothetical protein [Streptomyces hoynatensis]RKN42419.1 hypothetical protein D7294_13500 [Streptomyces hoynatensis]